MTKVTYVTRMVTLTLCVGLMSGFSIKEKLKEPSSKELDARVLYLLNIIRQLKNYSDKKDQERQLYSKLFDTGGGVLDKTALTQKNEISLEKKDFGILPPSSEWCRMMGFRACRQHS